MVLLLEGFFSLRRASRLLYREHVNVRLESSFEFYITIPNVLCELYFCIIYGREVYQNNSHEELLS